LPVIFCDTRIWNICVTSCHCWLHLSEKLLTSGPRQVTRGWRKDNKDSNRATDSTIGLLLERDHAPPISKDLYVRMYLRFHQRGSVLSGKVKSHASQVRILTPFVFPAHPETKNNRNFPPFLLVLPPVGPLLLFSGDIAATRIIIQMLLDNSLGTSDRDISPDVNTPSLESRGSSPGESMLSSACSPMLPDDSSPAPALIPRHFPPPALAGVPVDYIIHKLHQLAPKYWDKPDTADCTISKIIRLPCYIYSCQ